MFDFLGRGRAKSDKPGEDPGPSTMPMLGVHNSATQREMVRFALHNVLKLNGIPNDWLVGETVPVHIPGQGEAMVVQLQVMQWHDTLVLHGPALQRELMEELRRFDPDADASRYLFTWIFAEDCNCPHMRLPQPDFWIKIAAHASMPATKEKAPAAAKAPSVTIHLDDSQDDDDHGFAPTQIRDTQ